MPADPQPRVALFVTCLVDLFRPAVGFAAVKLLEDAGCRVEVPRGQTCCGQPAYNSGRPRRCHRDRPPHASTPWRATTTWSCRRAPAPACSRSTIPSCSPPARRTASARRELAARTYELTGFLVDVLGVEGDRRPSCTARATYHDSCSCLREVGVRASRAELLAEVARAGAGRARGRPRSAAASAARSASNTRRSRPRWWTTRSRDRGDRGRPGAGRRSRLPDEHRRPSQAPRLQVEARHVAEVLAGP